MIERALVVEEPEEQRCNAAIVSLSVPADHAIGGPQRLELEHRPRARLIGLIAPLCHDAVQRAA